MSSRGFLSLWEWNQAMGHQRYTFLHLYFVMQFFLVNFPFSVTQFPCGQEDILSGESYKKHTSLEKHAISKKLDIYIYIFIFHLSRYVYKGPAGCLQYFTGTTGTIATYNFPITGTHDDTSKYPNRNLQFKICHTTFLNYVKFYDPRIL